MGLRKSRVLGEQAAVRRHPGGLEAADASELLSESPLTCPRADLQGLEAAQTKGWDSPREQNSPQLKGVPARALEALSSSDDIQNWDKPRGVLTRTM